MMPNLRIIKLLNIFTDYVPTIKTNMGYLHYEAVSDTLSWKESNKLICKAANGKLSFITTNITIKRRIVVF